MDVTALLAGLANPAAGENPARIHVLTGARGAGKTPWCQSIVHQARQAGLRVSGLIAPGRFDQGVKTGFYAHCLGNDERRLLASIHPGELDGFRLGHWTFDPQTFAWGNAYLSTLAPTDLLVIDELGHLEFNQGRGWTAGFTALARQKYRLALVVIRPECIPAFVELGYTFSTDEILRPPAIRPFKTWLNGAGAMHPSS